VRELITLVSMSPHDEHSWLNPVLKTEAVRDQGVAELVAAVQSHQDYLSRTGQRAVKLREFLKNEVFDILVEQLQKSVEGMFQSSSGEDILERLTKREIDPYEAAKWMSGTR
jgi:LAO/AO transport system kinase